jgi:lambda family phage portal protein
MKFSVELSKNPPALPTGRVLMQKPVQPSDAAILRAVAKKTGRLAGGQKCRMYDAAQNTNLNQDFPVSITSANAEIFTSINATRARCRRLVRDNPYATGILNTHIINVGGEDPFPLEMRVGKKDASGKFTEEQTTNDMIQAAWADAGKKENCLISRDKTRAEFYWTAIASIVESGGIYGRHWRAFPNNKYGYAVEEIENDRVDQYFNRVTKANDGVDQLGANGNQIIMSKELDKYGGPVAYWILTRHPGDVYAYSNSPRYRERVPAADVFELHNLRLRPGQVVGMPRLSSVVQRLHRLDQYDIAEQTAAIVGAVKIGFFTKQNTQDEYVGDEEAEDGLKIDRVEPGINFEELPEGYDVKPFESNHPGETYPDFCDQNLRSISTGVGISHSATSGNYQDMSFSTGRLEKLPERDTFKMLQEHTIENLVRPHFNEWLKYAILSGVLALPFSRLEEFQNAAIFHAKRWPYINPLQDIQADALRIKNGLDSRNHVIAESERGGDVQQVDAEIASDRAIDEIHGLDFTNPDDPPSNDDEDEDPPNKPE